MTHLDQKSENAPKIIVTENRLERTNIYLVTEYAQSIMTKIPDSCVFHKIGHIVHVMCTKVTQHVNVQKRLTKRAFRSQ